MWTFPTRVSPTQRCGLRIALAIIGLAAPVTTQPAVAMKLRSVEDFSALTIDELANVEISSVSKRAEPLERAPAAIYAITNEDIRRSGARSLPEALRLAPNLQVAQINASSYAITARGFNHPTGTANKLLVMIDGRSVYTTLYSGVFWDAQDVLLEDVERIEVIRGPGGTLWGANAVDGVINVITRKSANTQGGMVNIGIGDQDSDVAARFGGTVGETLSYRVYGQGFARGSLRTSTGVSAADGWDKAQGGFRADWAHEADKLTVQGDLYAGDADDIANTTISGHNLLARWTRNIGDASTFELQTYYDHTHRKVVSLVEDKVSTYDVMAQFSTHAGAHQLVGGVGHRLTHDNFWGGPGTSYLDPGEDDLNLTNVFLQDAFALTDNLDVIAGAKAERNTYTGWEFMPNARVVWNAAPDHILWGAISRAMRTPSRFDRDLFNPGLLISGGVFKSEDVLAYEVGYRGRVTPRFLLSVAAYYNVYDDLRTVELGAPLPLPLSVRNGMEGETYGIEAWGRLTITDRWHLSVGGNAMHKSLTLKPGVRDFFGVSFAGNDPDVQFSVRSLFNISDNIEFDTGLRYVDSLPNPAVPHYVEADARLAWRPTPTLEVSLVGKNLLHKRHAEFGALPGRREVPRSVYGSARWDF
jgi:iron complex outermembrane receptor protein